MTTDTRHPAPAPDLSEWADWDVASYALGRELGVFADDSAPAPMTNEQAVATAVALMREGDPLGADLRLGLLVLTGNGSVERRYSNTGIEQFRWAGTRDPEARAEALRRMWAATERLIKLASVTLPSYSSDHTQRVDTTEECGGGRHMHEPAFLCRDYLRSEGLALAVGREAPAFGIGPDQCCACYFGELDWVVGQLDGGGEALAVIA